MAVIRPTDRGADADHLKSVTEIPAFVEAGYSFFIDDPGEYVENAADSDIIEFTFRLG